MDSMLARNRELYCVLEEHPCTITKETTWSDVYERLDSMLRRQYVGRIQNAYHIGQLVGTLRIATTTNPRGGPIEVPILPMLAGDANRIWVGGKTLLPDKADLRKSVRELYSHAERNLCPSEREFESMTRPILSYYQPRAS